MKNKKIVPSVIITVLCVITLLLIIRVFNISILMSE